MTPCAPAPAPRSHHEPGGSTSPVADAERQGQTQICLHILLQLFGYICERCPQSAPFLLDLWPPTLILAPDLHLQSLEIKYV